MITQRYAFITLILFSSIYIFTSPMYSQDDPVLFPETVNKYTETQNKPERNEINLTIREGDTLISNYKQPGLVDRTPKVYPSQFAEPHVSDNQQEVDQEWYAQTSKNINIMSKVFDHVMKEAFGDGYQQSGFFNKGCQGFWIPNQGIMFQLQVNFPLEDKPDNQVPVTNEETDDDLWMQMESQISGNVAATNDPVVEVYQSKSNTDRTKELQDLIIETITKYGKKFDSFGDDESIMVMVHGPQYVSYFSPNLMGQPVTNVKDASLLSPNLTLKQEQLDSLLDEYETQLKRLENQRESEQKVLSRRKDTLSRLRQQYEAGVTSKESMDGVEINIIEAEQKLNDTTIGMEALHKKISDLKEKTDEEMKDDVDFKSHYESLIHEKVANELKEMIGEGNFKIQVDAVFDWGNSTITNIHIDADRPVQATQKQYDENVQLQESTISTGVVTNVEDEDITETNKTTIEEIINNNHHPWTKTLTDVKDGTVKQINITVKLNDDLSANRTTAFLDENGTIKRQEETNSTTWSPESLSRFKSRLKHKLGIPNFPNGDFPPVEFTIVSESFRDETKQKVPILGDIPILGGLFKRQNTGVSYQPVPTNKMMIMQVKFSELNPEATMFKEDDGMSQSEYEDQVKDSFRITIY